MRLSGINFAGFNGAKFSRGNASTGERRNTKQDGHTKIFGCNEISRKQNDATTIKKCSLQAGVSTFL
jgi:hypothetical protein